MIINDSSSRCDEYRQNFISTLGHKKRPQLNCFVTLAASLQKNRVTAGPEKAHSPLWVGQICEDMK